MLILNRDHIKKSIHAPDVLKAMEDALLAGETESFLTPDRMHISFGDNQFLLMPSFGGDFISTKLVSVFPDNNKTGIPTIFGSVLLMDGLTGRPLAMLEGALLTALRTGAIGGLAIAYTTPANADRLGLFGAGQQGFHQLMFAGLVRNLAHVSIYDPFAKDIAGFIDKLKYLLRIQPSQLPDLLRSALGIPRLS